MQSDDPSSHCVVRVLLEALKGAGARRASSVLDETCVLHVSGSSGLAGDYQGPEAILGWAAQIAEATDRTVRVGHVRSLEAAKGRDRFRVRVTARRDIRRLDTDFEFELLSDRGRVRHIWLRHPDQPHVDEFWS